MKLRYLLPYSLLLLCACNHSPKNQTAKTDSTVAPATIVDTIVNKANENPSDISGYYEEADDEQTSDPTEACNVSVTIKKTNTGYLYHLEQDTIKYNGRVTMTQNADKTTGIVFEGIKYAEYEGDISNKKDDEDAPELTLPVGVGGQLEADTITIQNYGNSMNYYVQLGGCGVKFLRLVKKHK